MQAATALTYVANSLTPTTVPSGARSFSLSLNKTGDPAETGKDALGDLLAPSLEAALEQAGERAARRDAVRNTNDTQFAELLTRVPR